jgi:hypothetical protein
VRNAKIRIVVELAICNVILCVRFPLAVETICLRLLANLKLFET